MIFTGSADRAVMTNRRLFGYAVTDCLEISLPKRMHSSASSSPKDATVTSSLSIRDV